MNQRPGSDGHCRAVFEADHRARLQTAIAHNARPIGADALVTHRFLADGADANGRYTIVVEAIHGQS
jgi:hypothetical protein